MQTSPFFTIITASLNMGVSIQRTLESIRNQTFKELEHVVVDGGSTDNTLEVVRAFEGTYNLAFVSEPDAGIADALNKGLKLAKGKYVLVVQADDCLPDLHALEKVYSLLKEETIDVYSFPVIMSHPEKGKLKLKPVKIKWWNRFKFIFFHQGTFVHKRVYEDIGDFRTEFEIAMDYDFFYRALIKKPAVAFGNFPVAEMSGEGIGTRSKFLPKRLEEEARVQALNEKSSFWRFAQFFFRFFYIPYKTRFLPLFRGK